MNEPVILSSYEPGRHNSDLDSTISRLDREAMWKDLSTIIISPADGRRIERKDGQETHITGIHPRIVSAWMGLMKPPNGKCLHILAEGMEVGAAYSSKIEQILAHPDLSNWQYIVVLEHDNSPPPDGLLKLLARMDANPEYAGISGLYFTKGEGGCAQCWGNPQEMPMNFRPQKPNPDGLLEVNGIGMGFAAYRLSVFRDPRLRRPWFKTAASREEGIGTQDLWFASDARKHGYRFAVDGTIRVGHLDLSTGIMW